MPSHFPDTLKERSPSCTLRGWRCVYNISIWTSILLQATGMKYLSIYRCQNLGTLVSSMTVGGNRETGSSWSPDTPLAPTQTLPQYCLHNFWLELDSEDRPDQPGDHKLSTNYLSTPRSLPSPLPPSWPG